MLSAFAAYGCSGPEPARAADGPAPMAAPEDTAVNPPAPAPPGGEDRTRGQTEPARDV